MGIIYLFGYTKMPHCFGQRARTRDLFSKPFRKHGITPLNKLLISYHKGEYVDVIADGAIQKGMPHKFYHGKNVSRRTTHSSVMPRPRARKSTPRESPPNPAKPTLLEDKLWNSSTPSS